MRRKLLVFLKAPIPGRVKTRLAAELGSEEAARAYLAMCRAVRDEVAGLAGIDVAWVYEPGPGYEDLGWLGLAGAEFLRQGDGDLGERLEAAFGAAFGSAERVCAIGVDSPGLPPGRFEEAFAALEAADAVFGPAEDGGYYLVGLKRHEPRLFRGIPWSSPGTLAASLAAARRAGLATRLLPPYFDVDTAAGLERWQGLRRTT